VVTTTAGGAATVVDPLSVRGVKVEQPSAETLARLKSSTGVDVAPARIIDMTHTGTQYDAMKAALGVLTSAPEFDMVVAVIGSSARFYPDLAVKPIVDSAGSQKPIAAFLVPEAPDALKRLSEAGVPNFHTPEACADAIAAALGRREPRAIADTHPNPPPFRGREKKGEGRTLDELEAYSLLDRLGVPRAPSVALDAGASKAPALPFRYPVAVKALSAEIAHKSDVGGVILNVKDDAALLAATKQIAQATKAPRVLVQPMTSSLGEALIGYRVDADVGPLVMVAAGGVLAEIYRDRSLRLAPVDLATAHEMIGEVAALKALAGYRGKPKGDLDALANALVALSKLAVLDGTAVTEAEVNPLMVRAKGQGVVAVDALVRMS
jgi:acyl-CoA synthetase (NDP forming)